MSAPRKLTGLRFSMPRAQRNFTPDTFALPQVWRCGTWALIAAGLVVAGALPVVPGVLVAGLVSPLVLYFAADLVGSPMPVRDALRLSWRRLRDSVLAAAGHRAERLALVAVVVTVVFAAVRVFG